MAKTQWILLFTTFLISCISVALLIISMATNFWIVAQASNAIASQNSEINYGLFAGSLTRYLLATEQNYKLSNVCLYDKNACVYSCQTTAELRADEAERIINGDNLLACPISRSFNAAKGSSLSKTFIDNYNESSAAFSNFSVNFRQSDEKPVNEEVINAGMWLSTVVFLSIAIVFATISATFSIVNIVFNPVEPIISIFGLYIWNGVASFATALTLILWGSLYGIFLINNISITDTLRLEATYDSSGLAALGFSYWLLFGPFVLSLLNIGMLLWRQHIINKEPPPSTINVEKNDFTIMLY